MPRPYFHTVATALAHAVLAQANQPGALAPHAILHRAQACLGLAPAWLPSWANALARQSRFFWNSQQPDTLAAYIVQMPEFAGAFAPGQPVLRVHRWLLRPAHMGTQPLAFAGCQLPQLAAFDALAEWLALAPERLHTLVHPAQGWRESANATPLALRHYRYVLRAKPRGGLRLIEAPKADLKAAQRRLLHGLLHQLPVHEAAHGFVPGRSVASHAQVHAGQAFVMAFDLRDFFTSISASRICALWRTLGYPPGAARLLTQLCTTRTPVAIGERMQEAGTPLLTIKRLRNAHLPQGAPTSPALANLCAFGLDMRLAGLAHRFGARYSRYADDLVFSGGAALRAQSRSLQAWVQAIAQAEGFALHPAKTRTMPAHRQQRITGVVVNQHVNLPRTAYDALRATLHHHALHPPADAALRAQLLGRMAWASSVLAPARVDKLHRLFAKIVFSE